MSEYLPDDIDKFFLDHLENYAEEPVANIWSEIDKQLSEKLKNKSKPNSITVLNAAVILACLLMPFLLKDPSLNFHQLAEKKSISKKLDNHDLPRNYSANLVPALKKDVNHNKQIQTDYNYLFLSKHAKRNFSVADMSLLFNPTKLNTEKMQRQLYCLHPRIFFTNNIITHNTPVENKNVSTIVKFSKKHSLSVSPFFSDDHISGRFIEQYEYDNDNESDYNSRETPDFSFTAGALAAYKMNKRFSLVSGVSVSYSMLSISSTAVNALKDNTGTYKFKLATSYGLAEISKSGITPAAGDSLFISGASLKLKYISFPLLINYNFNTKKVKLSAQGGIAINKIMSDKVEVDYQVQNSDELEIVNKIEGIKRTFFTINAGIEAGCPINRKIDMSLSPEIRYGINSINKGTPIKTYPINFGLAFHVNIKL